MKRFNKGEVWMYECGDTESTKSEIYGSGRLCTRPVLIIREADPNDRYSNILAMSLTTQEVPGILVKNESARNFEAVWEVVKFYDVRPITEAKLKASAYFGRVTNSELKVIMDAHLRYNLGESLETICNTVPNGTLEGARYYTDTSSPENAKCYIPRLLPSIKRPQANHAAENTVSPKIKDAEPEIIKTEMAVNKTMEPKAEKSREYLDSLRARDISINTIPATIKISDDVYNKCKYLLARYVNTEDSTTKIPRKKMIDDIEKVPEKDVRKIVEMDVSAIQKAYNMTSSTAKALRRVATVMVKTK